MNRREFLTASAVAGAGVACFVNRAEAACGGCAEGADMPHLTPPAKPAELNLCLQWGTIPGREIKEKLDYLEAHGYRAVELPTDPKFPASAFNDAMKGRKLTVATLCGGSDLSKADPAARQKEVERLKAIIDVAGAVKSVGLIICPARGKPELGFKELRQDFVENTGRQLAEHAAKLGTAIVLEPLCRNETPFLRQVADAASIARDVGPGCAVMGDFWHMSKEETSFLGAFLSAGPLLKHVHIASLGHRKVPGMDGALDNYVDGFRGLKLLGYRGAVSLECGFPDFKKMGIVGEAAAAEKEKLLKGFCELVRKQWIEA